MKLIKAAQIGARHWPAENAGRTARESDTTVSVCLSPSSPGDFRRRGYTLIEFIGVLAIMVVLASMLIPVILTDLDAQYVATETTNLATIQNALQYQITHTFQIPSETNWDSTIGSWLTMPTAKITSNARGYNRAYVYDTNGFGGLSLPYVQGNGLAVVPGNPRLMIVSSLSTNLPIVSGGMSSNQFTAIWNSAPGTTPSTWTNWNGIPGDLVIQRVNLQPLFCRVVLNAIDTNDFGGVVVQSGANFSPYICVLTNSLNNPLMTSWTLVNGLISSLVGNTTLSGPGGSGVQTFTAWYLQGTVINFYDTNTAPTSPNLESQLVVQNDCSYVFEDEAWRGLLTGWGTNGPGLLNTIVGTAGTAAAAAISQAYTCTDKNFKGCRLNNNDWNGGSHGDSCQTMSSCFHSYMLDYNNWCQEGFGTGSDNSCSKVNQDCQRIYNITQNMCQ